MYTYRVFGYAYIGETCAANWQLCSKNSSDIAKERFPVRWSVEDFSTS